MLVKHALDRSSFSIPPHLLSLSTDDTAYVVHIITNHGVQSLYRADEAAEEAGRSIYDARIRTSIGLLSVGNGRVWHQAPGPVSFCSGRS